MDHDLQTLIRQLQSEKCPAPVLDRVAERIAREKASGRPFGTSLAWAAALACLLIVVGLWQWQARREAQLRAAELHAAQAQSLVVQQTQEAFCYIGQGLLRAAAHTEIALLQEVVPPL